MYRIVVPLTPALIVTLCVARYVPVEGKTFGAGRFIVYTADATLLAGMPAAHAAALSVPL